MPLQKRAWYEGLDAVQELDAIRRQLGPDGEHSSSAPMWLGGAVTHPSGRYTPAYAASAAAWQADAQASALSQGVSGAAVSGQI